MRKIRNELYNYCLGAALFMASIPVFVFTQNPWVLLLGLCALNLLWLTGLSTQSRKEFEFLKNEIYGTNERYLSLHRELSKLKNESG